MNGKIKPLTTEELKETAKALIQHAMIITHSDEEEKGKLAGREVTMNLKLKVDVSATTTMWYQRYRMF